jgi:hypothetical protein
MISLAGLEKQLDNAAKLAVHPQVLTVLQRLANGSNILRSGSRPVLVCGIGAKEKADPERSWETETEAYIQFRDDPKLHLFHHQDELVSEEAAVTLIQSWGQDHQLVTRIINRIRSRCGYAPSVDDGIYFGRNFESGQDVLQILSSNIGQTVGISYSYHYSKYQHHFDSASAGWALPAAFRPQEVSAPLS